MLLQITAALLQIKTMFHFKLRQLYQIITNYGSFWCYYNTLLQITAGITNYDVITNYVVTAFSSSLLTRPLIVLIFVYSKVTCLKICFSPQYYKENGETKRV